MCRKTCSVLTAILFMLLSSAVIASNHKPSTESDTAQFFERIQSNPAQLKRFLFAMPKGGDLHMHLTGATYAEHLFDYAAQENLCINLTTYLVYPDTDCHDQLPLREASQQSALKHKIIDAWSMRHFNPKGTEASHDHFFSAFSKFYFIAKHHIGAILAEISDRAAKQNESYVEVMVSEGGSEARELGHTLSFNPDFEVMRQQLLGSGLSRIVDKVTQDLDRDEMVMRTSLACNTDHPQPGCGIKLRYILRAEREQAPELIFAQLLVSFEAVKHDPRIVGVNMVQSEDGPISMRDYELHMQMLGYLHRLYPDVSLTLHAGELRPGLVPHDGLTFHIHDAIHVAHANRIGHGVDIVYENDAETLFSDMAKQHRLVEINLTSNDQILGIKNEAHPLPLYLSHGVPVALSTDDEGVSRTTLTREYQRAALSYHLNYRTIKMMVRNSITYAFLPGRTLWQDYGYQQPVSECIHDQLGQLKPSAVCQAFLDGNEKARLQWDLEARFIKFESSYSKYAQSSDLSYRPPSLSRLKTPQRLPSS